MSSGMNEWMEGWARTCPGNTVGSVGKARRGDQAPELEGLPLTPSRSSTSCLMIRDALEDGSTPPGRASPHDPGTVLSAGQG